MILESRVRQVACRPRAVRRGELCSSGRLRAIELETELERIEQEIEDVSERARMLADELGSRYAIFRCEAKRYDGGQSVRDTGIMFLSRQTDECIESIYSLEQRRKELLTQIGK